MTPELQDLLARLLVEPSIPQALRRQIADALFHESRASQAPIRALEARSEVTMAPEPIRKLVYVHGICAHERGFSDNWWEALRPQLGGTFGDGTLDDSRLEVIWSDLVNQASLVRGAAAAGSSQGNRNAGDLGQMQAAAEIKEALRDRVDQQSMQVVQRQEALVGATSTLESRSVRAASGIVSIPGLNCIDDFADYLVNDITRQQIIGRFISVVGPQLHAGVELDIISHSWGTVVAYEGLRQLVAGGQTAPLVRNWFTVGAALSLGPVKLRLRDSNKDGHKPENTQRWINVCARGEVVGGPLSGRPYETDADFLNLEPTGCSSFFGLVSPVCAHSSYFARDNMAVNRDIFARFINS